MSGQGQYEARVRFLRMGYQAIGPGGQEGPWVDARDHTGVPCLLNLDSGEAERLDAILVERNRQEDPWSQRVWERVVAEAARRNAVQFPTTQPS